MKKFKVFTIVLVICLLLFNSVYTVLGAVYIEDWGYRFEKVNNNSAYEINKYLGDNGIVNVPKEYNGFKIVSVGMYSFINTSVTSVTLGKNITEIKDCAFINVTSLSDVVFNDSLTTIGSLAFAGCTGLTELVIPVGVTEIADDAFLNCTNLVIYCYTGSYAQQYAEDKGIEYVLIDAPDPTEPPTEPEPTEPAPTDAPTEPEPTQAAGYYLGDFDNNQEVETIDVTYLQRYLAGISYPQTSVLAQGDVDGDGVITIIDATFIQRYLAGIDTPYPIGEWISE